MRWRNTVMTAAFCAILLGPASLVVAEYAGLEDRLPSWVTIEDAKYLSGGISKTDLKSVLSLGGVSSGELQTALENEVGNHVPAKSLALLVNAGIQRDAIEASNLLFGWECAPAFYGSSLVSIGSDGRLAETPQAATAEASSSLDRMAKEYERFAADHADVNVFLYFAPDSMNVDGVPTAALMSNPLTYQDIRNAFNKDGSSYIWVDGGLPYDEFNDKWFKTDHHWTIEGAYDAYNRITDAMGASPSDTDGGSVTTYQAPDFYGSLSRRALDDDVVDKIRDIEMEYPDFKVTIDGEEASAESLVHKDNYTSGRYDTNKYANRYAEYFHGDFGLIQIDNPTPIEGGSVLIVGDSYTNCAERFFALQFETTYAFDPRHDPQTIDGFLREHPNVEDVVFIMRGTNFLSECTETALGHQ